jgi:hypothetical protein
MSDIETHKAKKHKHHKKHKKEEIEDLDIEMVLRLEEEIK